jgi:hypothetical protein
MLTLTTSECLDIALSSIVAIKRIASQLSQQTEVAQATPGQSTVDSVRAQRSTFLGDLQRQLDATQKWLHGFTDPVSEIVPRPKILFLLDTLEQLLNVSNRCF